MRAVSRAYALCCLAAGVAVAGPAAASMTIALRDQAGRTRTVYQDGSRVRIVNPGGDDDGEAEIVDLKTTENVFVYDDAKTYYDFGKSLAASEPARRAQPAERKKPAPASGYRALGETRQVNGISCAMYEHVVAGKRDQMACFAPWGGVVGARADFAWFDELMDRLVPKDARRNASGHFLTLARTQGLIVWMSSTSDHDTLEIVKLGRDPLPAAMFHVPPDYKEFSRQLTASEHPHIGPPPVDGGREPRDRRLSGRVSGLVGIVLAFGLIIGLLIQVALLHLFACLVMNDARFMQALVAAVIISGVEVVVELIGLPPVIKFAFGAFTVFASLKIAYGASIPRTLALCAVPGVIVGVLAWLAHVVSG